MELAQARTPAEPSPPSFLPDQGGLTDPLCWPGVKRPPGGRGPPRTSLALTDRHCSCLLGSALEARLRSDQGVSHLGVTLSSCGQDLCRMVLLGFGRGFGLPKGLCVGAWSPAQCWEGGSTGGRPLGRLGTCPQKRPGTRLCLASCSPVGLFLSHTLCDHEGLRTLPWSSLPRGEPAARCSRSSLQTSVTGMMKKRWRWSQHTPCRARSAQASVHGAGRATLCCPKSWVGSPPGASVGTD